jgi:hypothetical protein
MSSKPPYATEAQRRAALEDRYNRCGLIVVATITESHPRQMEDGGIFTRFCLDVDRYVRDIHPDSVDPCFWVRGGTIGAKSEKWSDTPSFQVGQRWVLSLPWSDRGPQEGWQYGRHSVALQVLDDLVVDRYGLVEESGAETIMVTRELPVDEYIREIDQFLRARDPDQLKERADHVVLGTVTRVDEHREVPRGKAQDALVTLEVEEVLKGDPALGRVEFRVYLLQYPFRAKPPSFVEGERCVVFLSGDLHDGFSVVGGIEGKYEADGQEVRNEFRAYPLGAFVESISQ